MAKTKSPRVIAARIIRNALDKACGNVKDMAREAYPKIVMNDKRAAKVVEQIRKWTKTTDKRLVATLDKYDSEPAE